MQHLFSKSCLGRYCGQYIAGKQCKQNRAGAKTCGAGPSAFNRAAREIAKQKREAVRLVEELDILDSEKYHEKDRIAKAFKECEIDPTKRHVSVYDDTESESSVEEDDCNKDKRPERLRKRPSKDFLQ